MAFVLRFHMGLIITTVLSSSLGTESPQRPLMSPGPVLSPNQTLHLLLQGSCEDKLSITAIAFEVWKDMVLKHPQGIHPRFLSYTEAF